MANILFSPECFNLGETTRCIEVVKEAAGRGHSVHFHVYSKRFIPLIERAGLPVTLSEPVLSDEDAARIMDLDQGRPARNPLTLKVVRRRVMSELIAFRDFAADAVVIGSNPSTLISARVAGVPLFYVRPYAFSTTNLSLGPKDLNGVLPAPPLTRLLWHYLRFKPAAFVQVAREYGLTPPRRTINAMSADVNLLASTFPYLHNVPTVDRDVSIGPVFYRPEGELPAIARRERTRPVVYVAMGSSGSQALLLRILHQLSGANMDVLVARGDKLPREQVASLADNIHLAGLVPSHLLAGRIDASITHGGEGTVQSAALAGVPFAGIAMQFEQRRNITECVRNGNALRFSTNDIKSGKIPDIVHRLLTDESLRSSAAALGRAMAKLDGPARALDIIERHLAAGIDTPARTS